MQKETNKFANSTVFEGMVSIRALLAAQKNGHNDRKIQKILYNQERAAKLAKELRFLSHEGERSGFSLAALTPEEFDALSIGSSNGGLLALCSERTLPRLSEVSFDSIKPDGFYVMIQGIEDPYNFGYALRSLYALGIDGIILDERNWMTAAGVVARASAGASELFDVFVSEPLQAATYFKERGYSLVCADENTPHALEHTPIPYPVFLIIGGERRGISASLMQLADKVVRISYGRDFHAALSAASAATVLAYEIAKQNRKD